MSDRYRYECGASDSSAYPPRSCLRNDPRRLRTEQHRRALFEDSCERNDDGDRDGKRFHGRADNRARRHEHRDPVATSSATSFSLDLDTTALTNTVHTLVVSSQTRRDRSRISSRSPSTIRRRSCGRIQQSTVFTGLTQPWRCGSPRTAASSWRRRAGSSRSSPAAPAATDGCSPISELRSTARTTTDSRIALDPAFRPSHTSTCCTRSTAPIGHSPPVWNDTCFRRHPVPTWTAASSADDFRALQAAGNVMTGRRSTRQRLVRAVFVAFARHRAVRSRRRAVRECRVTVRRFTQTDYGRAQPVKIPAGMLPFRSGHADATTAQGGALRAQDS